MPVILIMAAVTFGLWEIGAGIIMVGGLMAFLVLILIIVAQLFKNAGVILE